MTNLSKTSNKKFSVKAAAWANNDHFPPLPKSEITKSSLKLKHIHELNFYAWKLIKGMNHTTKILKKLEWISMQIVHFTILLYQPLVINII